MMGTVTTKGAATLVDGAHMTVFRPQDLDRLVDLALADDRNIDGGAQRLIYAEDLKAVRVPGVMPSTALVVTIARGYGAAYFRDGQRAWVTHNDGRTLGALPELVYDDQAPSTFPLDAVIGLDQLRKIVTEYVRDGRRPGGATWVPAQEYLPW